MKCGLLEGIESVEGALEECCRTFLSSYLILGHPSEVLSNDGAKEKVSIWSLLNYRMFSLTCG
jgi:hypothetical protein